MTRKKKDGLENWNNQPERSIEEDRKNFKHFYRMIAEIYDVSALIAEHGSSVEMETEPDVIKKAGDVFNDLLLDFREMVDAAGCALENRSLEQPAYSKEQVGCFRRLDAAVVKRDK